MPSSVKQKVVKRRRDSDQAQQEITRLWPNSSTEVVDAKNDLRVFIVQSDAIGAKRKDPGHCVFARACQRTFGSTKVLFFKSVAYVELPDKNGKIRVERFTMGEGMRKLVEDFDRGKGIVPKAGFVLKAPTAIEQFETKRKYAREWAREASRLRKLGIKKKRVGDMGKGAFTHKPMAVDLTVRNGVGQAQFKANGKVKATKKSK